jgi:hypothetical protein
MSQTVATLRLPRKAIPDLPFVRILPEELNAHWDFIEPGLEQMRRLWDEPWKSDDVLRCLVDERAALYRRDDGFIVVEQCNEPISGRKFLNVWIAWFLPGHARAMQAAIIAWLDALKAAHSCEWIQFISPRDGWALEPHFVRHRSIWRRK